MQVPGCSLAVLHIDQKALRLSMACCGGANALIGELVHGLAAQVIHRSRARFGPLGSQARSHAHRAFADLCTHDCR